MLSLMAGGDYALIRSVEGFEDSTDLGKFQLSRVETTNKKLIDRGTRLVAHSAGVDYDTACYAIHEAMQLVAEREQTTRKAPSRVTVAVYLLRNRREVEK